MDQREYHTLILAGLLHDVGAIWTRAEGAGLHGPAGAQALRSLPDLFPAAWREQVWSGVEGHHAHPATRLGWGIRAADRLAAGELVERGDGDPAAVPLRPAIAQVDLGRPLPQGDWGYPLERLSKDGPLFPREGVTVSSADYATIRDGLKADLEQLASCGGVTGLAGFTGLLSILRRWTTYVPASVPGEKDEEYPPAPDISLYDHLKLTGAVAACLAGLEDGRLESLAKGESDAWANPVALMLRADFSGIQGFIYRITASRADGTFAKAARRLRGRSLYLTLLAEVVADWFLRKLDLPPTNVLFNGGGRFDLLLPLGAGETVAELEKELQRWLLKAFYGELGVQVATAPVCPADLSDMREVYGKLDDALATSKRRKFELFVRGQDGPAAKFHVPGDQHYHACNVCHLTPLPDPGACDICRLHERIGQKLPTTSHIAFLYGDATGRLPEECKAVVSFFEGDSEVTAALLNKSETNDFLQRAENVPGEAALYRLNDADCISPGAPPGVAQGFRFLATEAPLDAKGENVLDFDGIAKQSQGAKLLGVLKADVDRMGFIFNEGMTPTLSRASALSGTMELFFGGWLNTLCQRIAPKTFYAVYAGGDDLMILGPWDQVLTLAQELYADFCRYACNNENVTLSAGVLLVKPHFPIHRFARLAGGALDTAKEAGRDRITVFAETVNWLDPQAGYGRLLEFGQALAKKVEERRLPKGFVYFLKRLHDAHFDEGGVDLMWVPKFHYTVARRVSHEVIRDLNLLPKVTDMMEHIQVPVSFVSLKTRKE